MVQGLVESPQHAVFVEEEPLYEGADPSAALIVTVHQVEGKSVCNTWVRYGGVTRRLIAERVLDDYKPGRTMLMGELSRLAAQKSEKIHQDPHLDLAIRGLARRLSP